jgi:hypothetical protein
MRADVCRYFSTGETPLVPDEALRKHIEDNALPETPFISSG